MADTTTLPAEDTGRPKGLLARAMGVIFSPRATYTEVAARPKIFGAMAVVIVGSIAAYLIFSSTEVGKNAILEQLDRTMQSFGRSMTDAQYAQMQTRATGPTSQAIAAISQFVAIPIIGLVVAGLIIAVYNAILGGNATFQQVFAIVVHSWFLQLLQQLFVLPLDYAKQSMSSPTTLAIFMPFLDDNTFPARFFGFIDLFRIWWIVNLAIGIGVLYKRRTTPIATTMLVLYAVIALIAAAVGLALSGA